MRKVSFLALIIATLPVLVQAADLRVPLSSAAGQPMTVGITGTGDGVLYLIGPAHIIKRSVRLDRETSVVIKGEELRTSGRWIAVLRSGDSSQTQVFWVTPAKPENLSFLARPSRVPVDRRGVISGMAFVFDAYQNFVLQPAPVAFSLSVGGSSASQTVTSRNGVAWVSSSSARKAGPAQFVATLGETSVRRVVQQVASDPCNLRIHVVQQGKSGVVVETDPVRDCTGNPVPDGTIVTFTQTDSAGRSTVDARIRKGIARAELPTAGDAQIAVAAGVVLGNELHVGGRK
ncbi:MAG TPA: hypothetical protein VKE93_11880 [Candidatus Angelobacter sp.]|nr:hypothetical protein [Candidatus Angelobacter sp.]